MLEIADFYGLHSGYDVDKAKELDLRYCVGKNLHVPILEKSPWVYECELDEILKKKDSCICTSFIRCIWVDRKIPDHSYSRLNLETIKPLIYSPGGYYGGIRKIGLVGEEPCKHSGSL